MHTAAARIGLTELLNKLNQLIHDLESLFVLTYYRANEVGLIGQIRQI